MDTIRVTAKTVEDALLEASIELGTSSDNIEYTVIDKGSSGFFGIGGRKAVIEAKRKFTDEDLKKEIFGEKTTEKMEKAYKKESSQDRKEYRKEPKKEAKKESGKEPKKEFKKEPVKEEKKEVKKEVRKEEKAAAVSSEKAGVSVSREDKGKEKIRETKEEKREVRSEENSKAVVKAVSPELHEEERAKAPRVPADPEETKKRAVSFLSEVLEAMQIKAEISTDFEDENLSVNLSGEDMGVLIGKRGQTLDSLQYLTSLVVNKGKASYVRVKLDTEDYRNRRKATLENLAKNIAYKVKRTGKPVFLEPMNPYERRIIHSALQNDSYVTTHSEGEEPYRKVVVTLRREREKEFERSRERERRDGSRYYRRSGRYQDRRERRSYYGQADEKYDENTPLPEEEQKVTGNTDIEE